MPEETKQIKIRTTVIDTLTAIQIDQYMADIKKPGHDKWKDYGQSIYTFLAQIEKELGFEIILILGEPGTGKSSGMRTLPHNTNIWCNGDGKNPVWVGGKAEYGTKTNPRMPYHIIPKSYGEIIEHLKGGLDKGMFEDQRFAFVLAHLEQYDSGAEGKKERLKTLGQMATKMQLEGKAETVMYSRVKSANGIPTYMLETQNNGANTARSHMEMFEPRIDNDFNFIIEKLLAY